MLPKSSRFVMALMGCLILAPLIGHLDSSSTGTSKEENRVLASLPPFPRTQRELKSLPGRLDAYFQDHFGFRDVLIGLHAWITVATSSTIGNAKVFPGSEGWLFYRGDSMLEQSSGRIFEILSSRAHGWHPFRDGRSSFG